MQTGSDNLPETEDERGKSVEMSVSAEGACEQYEKRSQMHNSTMKLYGSHVWCHRMRWEALWGGTRALGGGL